MHWSTRPLETAVAGVLALALGLAVLTLDLPGQLLVGAAALLMVGIAVRDVLLAPRLQVDVDRAAVRGLGGTTVIPLARLRARVRTGRRWGMRSTTLELEDDADETVLVVLTRRDLGADPEQVGAVLLGHRSPEQPS